MCEAVTEGSYIKVIDIVSGQGSHMQASLYSPLIGWACVIVKEVR